MSLLVLMYHRAQAGRYGNAPERLDAHFAHLARTAVNVLPGEPLASGRLNVCLSFDDGYFDFRALAFPLLRKHGLRALLAVSPSFVRETVDTADDDRLRLPAERAYERPELGGFCTWSELESMVCSGHVEIAAHGHTHSRLDLEEADLNTEITLPRTLIESRLGRPVRSFVFPYGRFSSAALRQAKASYRHLFRIGGASNRNWEGRVIYRISADEWDDPAGLLSRRRRAAYCVRFWWNRCRGR